MIDNHLKSCMNYLFTSESVSEGHPDKVADQISDTVLDQYLAWDPQSKVACETLVTTGQVVLAGEVKSKADVDLLESVRAIINKIGYTKAEYKFDGDSCGIFSALHAQSADINRGVERNVPEEQGAGDQGMMFGYATNETHNRMPLTLELSHLLLIELAKIRREADEARRQGVAEADLVMPYLRPDAKSQVTVEYDGETNQPVRVNTIVISTQHDDFIQPTATLTQEAADEAMVARIKQDVRDVLIPRLIKRLNATEASLFDDQFILHVNPTGKFVIGGPHGDTGLTGRKIIVDTYGGHGAHGGGAFSGKDPSKVDRSAAYAARHIANNLVAAGVCDKALVQVAYAIGVAQPVSLFVNTYGTAKVQLTDAEISAKVQQLFDMTPRAIEQRLKLRNPIYTETAAYGHFGRPCETVTKQFKSRTGELKTVEVELFTWEKLDYVEKVREAFAL